MWHFDKGTHGIPTYKIDNLEEFLFWESLKEIKIRKEKETPTMQVTYNGFTGELVKLEKKETGRYMVTPYDTAKNPVLGYDISIYDREKKATISFTGVKLGDVKFGGGAVTFDG